MATENKNDSISEQIEEDDLSNITFGKSKVFEIKN